MEGPLLNMPEVSKYAGSAKYAGSVGWTAVVIEGLAENFHFPFQDRRSDGMLASDELRSPLRDPFPAFVANSDIAMPLADPTLPPVLTS